MTSDNKDFGDNLDFGEDVETELVQHVPDLKNVKDYSMKAKKAERGPMTKKTYSIPLKIHKALRTHVLQEQSKGVETDASQIVSDLLEGFLDGLHKAEE